MHVLLVRHGEAVDTRSAPTDRDRWLTNSGRRAVAALGTALAELDLRYSLVYTSPLVRAVQTAEILAATHPAFHGPIEVHPALSSEQGTIVEALAPLEQAGQDDLVVLVTHMPKIGALAGHLCRLSSFPSFRTASACLVVVEEGVGRLQWMLDPDTLAPGRR
jgi:phosphohistidine phosphatase